MVKPQVFATKAKFELLSYTAQEEWKIDLKKYKEATSVLNKILTSCYSVIWGQMSNALWYKVWAEKDFKIIKSTADAWRLFGESP